MWLLLSKKDYIWALNVYTMIEDKDLMCQGFPADPDHIAFSGQSTKHRFEIVTPGFSMRDNENDWSGVLSIASGQNITINKDNIVWDAEEHSYLCITSESTWIGKSTLTITANVPDPGFQPSGIRIEIFKVPFINYIKP